MPSVKIKRSEYDTLQEGQPTLVAYDPKLLGAQSVELSGTVRHRRPSTAGSGQEDLSPQGSGRPRGRSIIADQVTKIARNARASDLRPRPSRDSFTGQESDIVINTDGQSAEALSRQRPMSISSGVRSMTYADDDDHVHDDVVDHLDVIDAQVGTVSALTNAANSVVLPPFSIYHRKPVIHLSKPGRKSTLEIGKGEKELENALDRHVEDVLANPSKFRRTVAGLFSFLKTPLGVITAIYGFLVVFWGAAIIFFLAKIINLHDEILQGFWVEVSSQVVNALFTLTGVGLLPGRLLDTYRIVKIWRYKRRTTMLRKSAGLPPLIDVDDLPDPVYDSAHVHVLTDKEQLDLHRQQEKFRESQTWYRPHGTETHRAFPISTALWICFLIDLNSVFQIILCGTMWGLNRFQRPPWSTGILIPAGFICGIGSGVFIWRGGQQTKRVNKVETLMRNALRSQRPMSQISHNLEPVNEEQERKMEPASSKL